MTDRYDIKELLGEGGFGETFVATDTQTGDEVVVKKLHLKRADDWKGIELFEREAEVLETLDHPRIPKYLDYFEEEEGDGMRLCLVQERAPGISLEDKVASGWRCDDPEKMLRDLLDILIYLQSLRPPIVHRDIKPSNIVVADDGSISLVDFGAVANALTDSIGGSTMIGTLGYMAPEQQIGRVEMNTDLFGTAICIVYAVTGDSPEKMPRVRLKIDSGGLGFSEPVQRVIDSMVEPVCEDRPRDAKATLELLNQVPTPIPIASAPPAISKASVPTRSETDYLMPPRRSTEPQTISPQPSVRLYRVPEFIRQLSKVAPLPVEELPSVETEFNTLGWVSTACDALIMASLLSLFLYQGLAHALIVFVTINLAWLTLVMSGMRGEGLFRQWVQGTALEKQGRTPKPSGRLVTRLEGDEMTISEPRVPYPFAWSRVAVAMPVLFFVLTLLLELGSKYDTSVLALAGLAVFGLFYFFGKLAHIYARTSKKEFKIEINRDSIATVYDGDFVLDEVSIDEVRLRVKRSVHVLYGSPKPPSYSLIAQGRDRSIQLLSFGTDKHIDPYVLTAIDDHITRLQSQTGVTSNVAFDFDAQQESEDVVEVSKVIEEQAKT